jgi:hypothetical protein
MDRLQAHVSKTGSNDSKAGKAKPSADKLSEICEYIQDAKSAPSRRITPSPTSLPKSYESFFCLYRPLHSKWPYCQGPQGTKASLVQKQAVAYLAADGGNGESQGEL